MKYFDVSNENIKIHGLNVVDQERGQFWRLPQEIMDKMPEGYIHAGKRCTGGRLRFKTNSTQISVKYILDRVTVDICMPLPGSAGIDVYSGYGTDAKFLGYAAPVAYSNDQTAIEKVFSKSSEMENITVNFPRNEHVLAMEIGVEDNAKLLPPDDYHITRPIVFYGSSITEGGCAPRPGNQYTSILCRWLDADYYCYGFSGAAKGEIAFAEFIAAHKDMSLFVYDYDHNAPDPEHLLKTHEPFFHIVRRAHPKLPVILMTRPDFKAGNSDNQKRRDAVYRTFINAKNSGDENIYFIDGEQFFGFIGREECTIDGCHPNALGFMRMAETIYPLAKSLLGK